MSSKKPSTLTLVASEAAIGNLVRRGQITTALRPIFMRESGPTWVNSPRMSQVAPAPTSVRAAFEASADRKAA